MAVPSVRASRRLRATVAERRTSPLAAFVREVAAFNVVELHERTDPAGCLSVIQLERWLIAERLAVPIGRPGWLAPTR